MCLFCFCRGHCAMDSGLTRASAPGRAAMAAAE